MASFSIMGIAALAALPTVNTPADQEFEARILAKRDNGLVVELTVSCPLRTPGVMHYDKIGRVFTDSKNVVHASLTHAYASTCGIGDNFVASR